MERLVELGNVSLEKEHQRKFIARLTQDVCPCDPVHGNANSENNEDPTKLTTNNKREALSPLE